MSNIAKSLGILLVATVSAGCISHGPGGVAYSTRTPESIGATGSGAGGALSGSQPAVEKEKRGNTPPGMDRDGHGPAAGAIVDPTGAATRGKPY